MEQTVRSTIPKLFQMATFVATIVFLLLTLVIATVPYKSTLYLFDEAFHLDTCAMDRFSPDFSDLLKQEKYQFTYALVFLLFCVFFLLFKFNREIRLRISYYQFIQILYTASHYYSSWTLITFLKHVLDDKTCNKHVNSVSGHYNFFIFMGLAVPVLYWIFESSTVMTTKPKHVNSSSHRHWFLTRLFFASITRQNMIWILFYLLYLSFGLLVLSNTYWRGYHSLRQIIYGITFSLVSFWFYHYTLTTLAKKHRKRVSFKVLFFNALGFWIISSSIYLIYAYMDGILTLQRIIFHVSPPLLFILLIRVCIFLRKRN